MPCSQTGVFNWYIQYILYFPILFPSQSSQSTDISSKEINLQTKQQKKSKSEIGSN